MHARDVRSCEFVYVCAVDWVIVDRIAEPECVSFGRDAAHSSRIRNRYGDSIKGERCEENINIRMTGNKKKKTKWLVEWPSSVRIVQTARGFFIYFSDHFVFHMCIFLFIHSPLVRHINIYIWLASFNECFTERLLPLMVVPWSKLHSRMHFECALRINHDGNPLSQLPTTASAAAAAAKLTPSWRLFWIYFIKIALKWESLLLQRDGMRLLHISLGQFKIIFVVTICWCAYRSTHWTRYESWAGAYSNEECRYRQWTVTDVDAFDTFSC